MSEPFASYAAVSAGCGYFIHPHAAVLRVSGPDAERYLQGRVTQDIKGLADGSSVRSLLLSPQGKIQAMFEVQRAGNEFLLAARRAAPDAQAFTAALLQFKVADQLTVELEPGRLLALFGPQAGKLLRELKTPHTVFYGGQDIYCSLENLGALKGELAAAGASEISEEVYHMLRIERGEPLFGIDVTEKNGAPDLNLEDFVSFTKGCYSGQEVVEMAAARGKPNKLLTALIGSADAPPAAGTEVTANDGSRAGKITSAALYPTEPTVRCLAFLKYAALDSGPFSAGAAAFAVK